MKKAFRRAALVLALLAGAAASAEPLYVAPNGDDRAAGTREQPLASLAAALRRVADRDTAQEIVLRAGTYPGGITIPPREGSPPPLTIRAAKRPDGSWEDVVIDGAERIESAAEVPGRPRVYRLPLVGRDNLSHSVWEEETRVRYVQLADLQAVERVPASFAIDGGQLFFHTSDGKPPESHRIGRSRDAGGIRVQRRQVTLQGLQLRGFVLGRQSYAIRVDVGDITLEDCRVWNARRAIHRGPIRSTVAGRPYGADTRDLHVRRCRADDVGVGFFGHGGTSVVEDSQFFYRPGPFEIREYSQDQSGIQSYTPATGAHVRRNLVVGFNSGIFFKSGGSDYLAEFNTIVGTGDSAYGMGRHRWPGPGRTLFRYNVLTGFQRPILHTGVLPPPGAITGNLIWFPAGSDPRAGRTDRDQARAIAGNLTAQPRFADPRRDDYRLLPDSPGAQEGPGGVPLGARGVADGRPETLLPPVASARISPESAFDRGRALGLRAPKPRFVRHAGPPRAWYVDPAAGSDEPVVGTSQRPLRTLQLALDHANPGDRVVLLPGLYLGRHVLAHGGREGAPIVIEASPAGGAVLDGLKDPGGGAVLTLRNAPYVVVRGLELRWFHSIQFGREAAGIAIDRSPHVEIRDCEIWNGPWVDDRTTGIGIFAREAPHLVIDGCVIYAVDNGLRIHGSPGFRITGNTVTMVGHHGAHFVDSVQGSVFERNSLAYSGSHLMVVQATREEMASFRSDHNNLAANLRDGSRETGSAARKRKASLESDLLRTRRSKAIARWNDRAFQTLAAWRAASGQDAHSIAAHPLYLDPQRRDFRAAARSPNRGAGPGGSDIGAKRSAGAAPARPQGRP